MLFHLECLSGILTGIPSKLNALGQNGGPPPNNFLNGVHTIFNMHLIKTYEISKLIHKRKQINLLYCGKIWLGISQSTARVISSNKIIKNLTQSLCVQ